MLFRVSEKILSLSDNFTITDGQGTPKYIVIGQTFSLADKLSFQNPQGEELAFIQQNSFHSNPNIRYSLKANCLQRL